MVREELYPMWMVSQVGKLILKLEMISCQKEQSPLHIRQLSNQIEKLSPLLQKLCGRSWSDLAAQSAFSALYGALEGTFRYLYTQPDFALSPEIFLILSFVGSYAARMGSL
jgi:hypothetical protein